MSCNIANVTCKFCDYYFKQIDMDFESELKQHLLENHPEVDYLPIVVRFEK